MAIDAHTKISRRRLLQLGAGMALATGLWPGTLGAAQAAAESFDFLVLNDLHYTDEGCAPYFEKLVRTLKAAPADFILIAGDLSQNGTPEQINPIRDILKGVGKPLYVVPGNHEHVQRKERPAYDAAFPNSANYAFDHRGWRIVALDTTEGKNVNASAAQGTLDFAQTEAEKLERDRPLIVFTHFPLGPDVPRRLGNADALLERFRQHNLLAVYSGHHHGLTERKIGKADLTTNRCCSFKRGNHEKTALKGYFACRAEAGGVTRRFVRFEFP